MSWPRKLKARFLALFAKRQLDAEMDEEMRSHIEMQTRENIANGMPPEEARYAALRQFGHVEGIKETAREQREGFVTRHLSLVTQDVRFAFRQLRRSPGFTVIVVVMLALGIGGTTAVFSVADRTILNPIPGGDVNRLISVREVDLMHDRYVLASPPVIDELSHRSDVFNSVAYWGLGVESYALRMDDRTIKLSGVKVSPNFFDLFRLRPLAGRTFLPGEGSSGAEKVVVLGYDTWKQYFAGEPTTLGQRIELNGEMYSVIGIMPENIQFPKSRGANQLWVPYVFSDGDLSREWDRYWSTMARLHDGVTLSEAQAMLDVVAARRAESAAPSNEQWTLRAEPAYARFSDEGLRKTLWILLGMMAALLLIACANVASILLSRTLSRQGEIGIRMAVGAGRMRIARQMLVESLSLAAMAAVFGVLVSWGGIVALERFYLTDLPRINVIAVDWEVLGIASLIAIAVGVMFGMAPAWVAARTDVNHRLKVSGQRHSGGVLQRTCHNGLVVVQVSVAVVLLTGAGLMTHSAVKLLRVDPGLEPEGLYRVFYDTSDYVNRVWNEEPEESYDAMGRAFRRTAVERLSAIPGVASAAVNGSPGFSDWWIDGRETPVFLGSADVGVVEGDYLRIIGAKLVAGRLLTAEDAQPGRREVVINEEMARVCWPDQNPLGKRIRSEDEEETYFVVGVIQNIKTFMLEAESKSAFYQPFERVTTRSPNLGDYVVRSDMSAEALRDAVVQTGKALMAPLELHEFYSIQSQLYLSTAPRRVMMWLLLSLGGLGLLLSAMGVYAVLAYSVARRTREFGVRMALGATKREILALVMRDGLRLAAVGLALGIVGACFATRILQASLFGISPRDPLTLALVIPVLLLAAAAACYLPARRAARIHPMEALRHE